jgi:hypothetical protein
MSRLSRWCKANNRSLAGKSSNKQTPVPDRKESTAIHLRPVNGVRPKQEPYLGRRAAVRRVSSRRAVSQPRAAAAGYLWEATVINFSVSGIGLKIEARCRKGEVLQIDLLDCEFQRSLLARVVHVKQIDGDWVHGCKLLTTLTEDELEALSAPEINVSGMRRGTK